MDQVKAFVKKYFNFIFMAALIIITFSIIAGQVKGQDFLKTLGHTDGRFIAAALGCIGIYWLLEAWMILKLLRRDHRDERFSFALVITLIGQYYNLVTPGASGGQPLQLLEMNRRGYAMGTGTAVLVQKYALYQISVTLLALVAVAIHFQSIAASLLVTRTLIGVGLFVNVLGVVLVIIMAFSPKWAEKIMTAAVNFLAVIHLIKDKQKYYQKIARFVDEYTVAIDDIRKHWKETGQLLMVSFVQIIVYYSVNYWVYKALGLHGTSAFTIISLHAVLYVAMAFVPTPGASGGAEAAFALIFGPVYGTVGASVGLILWRLITFYFIIAFGGLFLSVRSLWLGNRDLKKKRTRYVVGKETDR